MNTELRLTPGDISSPKLGVTNHHDPPISGTLPIANTWTFSVVFAYELQLIFQKSRTSTQIYHIWLCFMSALLWQSVSNVLMFWSLVSLSSTLFLTMVLTLLSYISFWTWHNSKSTFNSACVQGTGLGLVPNGDPMRTPPTPNISCFQGSEGECKGENFPTLKAAS